MTFIAQTNPTGQPAPAPAPDPTGTPAPTQAPTPVAAHSAFRVLTAVAADELATSAVKVAAALTERRGAHPSLLYVKEMVPYVPLDGGFAAAAMAEELSDPYWRARDEAELRTACAADCGEALGWPFEIALGGAPWQIAEHARSVGADLIVMGLQRHGPVGRLLGNDTARVVMAMSGVPVLAVRPELTSLPKSVVVAIDFSRASLRAAQLARQLMDENGTMRLVFVAPPALEVTSEGDEGRRLIERNGVDVAFTQMMRALDPARGMTVIPVRRTGDRIAEIKKVCEEANADLLAIGSQRHTVLERLMIGRVTAAMVSDGRWSMLVTPPAAAAR